MASLQVFMGGVAVDVFTAFNFKFALLFWLRIASLHEHPVIRLLAKLKYRRFSRKYGVQIPIGTKIGAGLYIGHGIGIVINGKTKIGHNCNISQFLTIGSNNDTPATIGDNVYIGPGVSIIEQVSIGNNVKIGAGTIVINDIPDNCTSVGNPNRIIYK